MSSSLPNLLAKNNAKLALNKIPPMLGAHSNIVIMHIGGKIGAILCKYWLPATRY
ncbi:hypothetical protein ABMY44_15710 [Pseudoalteromonas sp. Cnat2-41]|uniref:hypothetical protein n=1 Tax=unclassified Pseudoalteromonas TaxID=194690 RepID=UPI001EF788DD|nr:MULTISPECIES: hypothetical protein [unclassified Pseudoalteromonas]MCF2863780.1 hypothetical protein [Pseudoalteromonas sp. CNAT2-18]MCG7559470.1 hypothetical protein [Pseudoalteromonas sp. CNAT2-18.1]